MKNKTKNSNSFIGCGLKVKSVKDKKTFIKLLDAHLEAVRKRMIKTYEKEKKSEK